MLPIKQVLLPNEVVCCFATLCVCFLKFYSEHWLFEIEVYFILSWVRETWRERQRHRETTPSIESWCCSRPLTSASPRSWLGTPNLLGKSRWLGGQSCRASHFTTGQPMALAYFFFSNGKEKNHLKIALQDKGKKIFLFNRKKKRATIKSSKVNQCKKLGRLALSPAVIDGLSQARWWETSSSLALTSPSCWVCAALVDTMEIYYRAVVKLKWENRCESTLQMEAIIFDKM